MTCLNCQVELKDTPGRRKKMFCSASCRAKYWQKKNPKRKPEKSWGIKLREILTDPKVKTEKKRVMDMLFELGFAVIKEVDNKATPSINAAKGGDKNEANNDEGVRVVTLESIRQSCPKELTGIDRTMWINDERKKYGI